MCIGTALLAEIVEIFLLPHKTDRQTNTTHTYDKQTNTTNTHLSIVCLASSISLTESGERFHSSLSAGFNEDGSTSEISSKKLYLKL